MSPAARMSARSPTDMRALGCCGVNRKVPAQVDQSQKAGAVLISRFCRFSRLGGFRVSCRFVSHTASLANLAKLANFGCDQIDRAPLAGLGVGRAPIQSPPAGRASPIASRALGRGRGPSLRQVGRGHGLPPLGRQPTQDAPRRVERRVLVREPLYPDRLFEKPRCRSLARSPMSLRRSCWRAATGSRHRPRGAGQRQVSRSGLPPCSRCPSRPPARRRRPSVALSCCGTGAGTSAAAGLRLARCGAGRPSSSSGGVWDSRRRSKAL
jgi:hypothetical protein